MTPPMPDQAEAVRIAALAEKAEDVLRHALREQAHELKADLIEEREQSRRLRSALAARDEEIARLSEHLREVCDELAAEVDHHYPADIREKYPSEQRRYDRDMDSVIRARALLASQEARDG